MSSPSTENHVQSFIDDAQYLIRKGLNNSVSFIKEFNEFHKSRNCSTLQMLSRDLYDELIKVYNQYVLSNGLFIKSLMKFPLNEYQSFCFNILTRNPQKYDNHWYTYISNYIFDKYDEDIKEIELEELKFIYAYYNEALSRRIKKLVGKVPKITSTFPDSFDRNMIDSFIKIGENIKYQCKGFFDNELLYMLCGIAIVDGINRMKNGEFNTFYSLFKFVKSYLQLWQFNKIFEFKFGDNHNLVTHIKSKGNYVKRYKMCEKYFDYSSHDSSSKTKLKVDKLQDSVYIETKLTTQEIIEIWSELENLFAFYKGSGSSVSFKKEDSEKDIYYVYLTSQLLTRSTCLSALIILNILYYTHHNKFVKTKKDEQLDWFAISVDKEKFKEEFSNYVDEVSVESVPNVSKMKVSDVLTYTHYYVADKLAQRA